MNNTLGIEYAYTRIHKLEVEALAYKDKITELEEALKTVAQTRCVSYEDLAIRDLEQQRKGIEDLFNSIEPQISMGERKLWSLQSHNVDCYLDNLRKQSKGGAE
jgi:hypothetical protein